MGNLLKSYVFWTYERGSFHYDVMVTLILVFIFGAPHLINFKDKPVETVALHASEVLVKESGRKGARSQFQYQVRAEDMQGAQSDEAIRLGIIRLVEPISGEVKLERYEAVRDGSGRVIAYNAWVLR